MSYDDKCHDLAEYFLKGDKQRNTPKGIASLAQYIQDAIEEWCEPHVHTCQQCDALVVAECTCDELMKNIWCSSRCREAFDL